MPPARFIPTDAGIVFTGRAALARSEAPPTFRELMVAARSDPASPFFPKTPVEAGGGIGGMEVGSVIQLGQSNLLAPGDFTGSLPGSTGVQGSTWVDLVAKGIDLAGTIVSSRTAAQQPMITSRQGMSQKEILLEPAKPLTGVVHPLQTMTSQLPEVAGMVGIRRRRRRMNVLNPKALRRGMRRVQGFAKFASKTISFTKRVRMKKARRR